MPAEKSISISFRVTPEFKDLLELAAAKEQRSRTNLLEKLLFDHCRQEGLIPAGVPRRPVWVQGGGQ
ncbi:hypothetical protein [Variovorax sp. GT1P44]|uniref:hypothetical protein n=1 Tax=Variovorax sp. GT1P44 TaxID=3443742 RepID=UPI003F47BE06